MNYVSNGLHNTHGHSPLLISISPLLARTFIGHTYYIFYHQEIRLINSKTYASMTLTTFAHAIHTHSNHFLDQYQFRESPYESRTFHYPTYLNRSRQVYYCCYRNRLPAILNYENWCFIPARKSESYLPLSMFQHKQLFVMISRHSKLLPLHHHLRSISNVTLTKGTLTKWSKTNGKIVWYYEHKLKSSKETLFKTTMLSHSPMYALTV